MKISTFPEQSVVIAESQPEYLPLPAYRFKADPQGRIVCCWKPSFRERISLLFGGCIWHQILTFNQPLQPQLIGTEKPEMPQ